MEIAKQIEKLLKKNNVTRLKLSKDTGIPYTTLTQIINGRTRNPQVKALETSAEYFNVSFDYLLGQSIYAIIEERLAELNMPIEDLAKATEIPQLILESLDTFPPTDWDFERGEMVDRIAHTLGIDFKTLATAYGRQEPPMYEGKVLTPEESFAPENSTSTIAAHHDGEDWTEEELEEIERFKQFVKMKRGPRAGE